jgi:hypothetical protein
MRYGEYRYSSTILDLDTKSRWRWVVSFTLWPLSSGKRGPRVGLDNAEKRKICREWSPGHPACSLSLYRLIIEVRNASGINTTLPLHLHDVVFMMDAIRTVGKEYDRLALGTLGIIMFPLIACNDLQTDTCATSIVMLSLTQTKVTR